MSRTNRKPVAALPAAEVADPAEARHARAVAAEAALRVAAREWLDLHFPFVETAVLAFDLSVVGLAPRGVTVLGTDREAEQLLRPEQDHAHECGEGIALIGRRRD